MRKREIFALPLLLALLAALGASLHTSSAKAAGTPPLQYTKLAGNGPMDLLAAQLDANGLLLNPYWRYQRDNNALPNVTNLCSHGDCTSQQPSFDTAPDGTWQQMACEAYRQKSATAVGGRIAQP